MGGILEKGKRRFDGRVSRRERTGGHERVAGPFLHAGILFLCLILTGVVSTDTASGKAKLKVATVKFEVQGKIDIPDAGAIVANWLTAALVQTDKFDVKERLSLDQVLSEQAMSQTGLIDPKTAAKVGSTYGVEAIVTGSVVRLDERLPIYISVRMIDTTTGTILKYIQGKAQSLGDLERTVFRLAEDLSGKKTSVVTERPAPAPIERPVVESRFPDKAPKAPTAASETPVEATAVLEKTRKDPGAVGVMEIRSSPLNAEVYLIDRSKKWLAPRGPSSDWRHLGATPYRNPDMPVGRYWIRLTSGSKEEIIEVNIHPGKTFRKMVMFQLIGEGGLGDYGGM